jgi:hypothetical protein
MAEVPPRIVGQDVKNMSISDFTRQEWHQYMLREWDRHRYDSVLSLLSEEGRQSVQALAIQTAMMEKTPEQDTNFMDRIGSRLQRIHKCIKDKV